MSDTVEVAWDTTIVESYESTFTVDELLAAVDPDERDKAQALVDAGKPTELLALGLVDIHELVADRETHHNETNADCTEREWNSYA